GWLCAFARDSHCRGMTTMTENEKSVSPTDPETLPYRPCVGNTLINREGRVWAGNRIPGDGGARERTGTALTLQMPQGGIDEGEDPATAALRELKEEAGTHKARIIGEPAGWLTYDLPPPLIGIALKGKYRGQKQKWFAMRFTGEDRDIDIA